MFSFDYLIFKREDRARSESSEGRSFKVLAAKDRRSKSVLIVGVYMNEMANDSKLMEEVDWSAIGNVWDMSLPDKEATRETVAAHWQFKPMEPKR